MPEPLPNPHVDLNNARNLPKKAVVSPGGGLLGVTVVRPLVPSDLPPPNQYPDNWKEIAKRIKDEAGWKCERCKASHSVEGARVLTVHHLDGDKTNCADWNLAALCQRCHLSVQGRVKMDQMFFSEILDVSEWFKPHLEGFLAAQKD